jgi:DNA invertase Pin-like site-specific DNA recombinase
MSNIAIMFPETKPDLVTALFQQIIAMAPGFSEALARQIEAEFRAKHAGESFVVLKRGPRLTPEQRQHVFQDGLTSMSTEEITAKHKIGRATLYRVMKSGGGRFSP